MWSVVVAVAGSPRVLAADKPTISAGMVIGVVALLVGRTRVHLLLLIAAGAILGALGIL